MDIRELGVCPGRDVHDGEHAEEEAAVLLERGGDQGLLVLPVDSRPGDFIGDRPVNSDIQPAGRPTTHLSDQECCHDWLSPVCIPRSEWKITGLTLRVEMSMTVAR
jgi:hypothetical protein